jgi:hypothetical protein
MAMTGMVRMALQLGRAGIVVDCSTGPKRQAGHKRRSSLLLARFTGDPVVRLKAAGRFPGRFHAPAGAATCDPLKLPRQAPTSMQP